MAALLLCVLGVKAQDYTGIYYIASGGKAAGNGSGYTYNSSNPANNFYLCPTEGWCFYQATNDFTGTDNGQPFFTTYKCRTSDYHNGNPSDAIWTIEKAPNSSYYYIKQTSTGKYMLSNGQIRTSTNADRIRVHLEAVTGDLDDKALFALEPVSGQSYVVIRIVSPDGVNNSNPNEHHEWLSVCYGNYPNFVGNSGKNGGPQGYRDVAGTVCIYTQSDVNAPFYLEPATVAPPTITNNFNGTITITSESGATIYYTIDETTPTTNEYNGTGTTSVTFSLTDGVTVIKAIAKGASDYFPSLVKTYNIPVCERPVITVSNNTATITCNTSGATIYYTTDGTEATTGSTLYEGSFSAAGVEVIRAIATSPGYIQSNEAFYYPTEVEVHSSNEITNMNGRYILADNFTSSASIGTAEAPFRGSIDGNYNAFSLSGHALIGVAVDAVIKNVVVSSVSYSGSGNVGAIVNTAKGATKIYNCGVLDGSVSGGTNTGGLVGLIEAGSSVRVVNCYNYADVSGSSYAAGIVGKNAGTVSDDGTVGNVRIALCMMYGNVTDATNISPVYGGNHENNKKKYTEYNYWRYRAVLPYTALNDQFPVAEDMYLTRFPYYRHILNTHRELAAFFLFGAVDCNNVGTINQDQIDEIGHWALKKDIADYPIIESWPSNTTTTPTSTHNNLPSTTEDYAGKLLTEMGTNGYLRVKVVINNVTITENLQLPITDMDTLNYDFTWGKVVLPFANEFEVNTDYTKICTGWKIKSVTKNGNAHTTFSATNYNVADRDNPQKDIYDATNNTFIFAQGGNYIVPYGVTNITIEANFADAYYLCDESYEIGYERDSLTAGGGYDQNRSGYVGRTALGGSAINDYHEQPVYHTMVAALDAMNESYTTHAQAIVLVGNYHMDIKHFDFSANNNTNTARLKKGLTIMSIDADNNQEPDYAIYSNYTPNRPPVPPMRFDFVAFIPMGMSSRVTNALYYPNTPIWKPRGWFEITETGLMRADQFELESGNFHQSSSNNNRCIINGGYFTQMVRGFNKACTRLSYYQIGGKAYIKEFYPGNHSTKTHANKLVPINVTGGEIEQCFMTGYGKGKAYGTDIYFWCAGGIIHKFLAAYMEPPVQTSGHTSSNPGTVNMTAKIDHARIYRFFGGGTTSNARITGDIKVTIDNSFVDFYCGGPEFGDMVTGENGKTVTTTAENTTFREYYGAGFGGTAITYTNDEDYNRTLNVGQTYPSSFFSTHYEHPDPDTGRLCYLPGYGIGNCYKYEFIMHSRGHQSVARFYTGYAMFSLAKTGNVTNTLTKCTIEGSFYGGGCQGTVDGTVASTLTGCTILHSAYGGGFKAESNNVEVYTTTYPSPVSTYNPPTGIFSDFGPIPTPDTYTWAQGDETTQNTVSGTTLFTSKDITMTDLGNVTGAITITLDGHTVVQENVFGGGNESKSLNDATVIIKGTSEVIQNVFGGGNKAFVGINTTGTPGNTTVKLQEGARVLGNVYGGGNEGPVGGDSKVLIQDESGTTPEP